MLHSTFDPLESSLACLKLTFEILLLSRLQFSSVVRRTDAWNYELLYIMRTTIHLITSFSNSVVTQKGLRPMQTTRAYPGFITMQRLSRGWLTVFISVLITVVIIYMKKFLHADWLKTCQLIPNSAKTWNFLIAERRN